MVIPSEVGGRNKGDKEESIDKESRHPLFRIHHPLSVATNRSDTDSIVEFMFT